MTDLSGIDLSFFAYGLVILLISILFYQNSKRNLKSYFLGAREVNPWVTALSAQASDMSAWLFMSLPAIAYLFGYQAVWIAIGLALGTYLNWRIVAARLRTFTVVFGDSITLPEYLQRRFKTSSPALQLCCSTIILLFFLLYVASGFNAQAKLFEELFGLEYRYGLFIGAFIIMFYTFLGGFLAVCWTDFFQSILMFFSLIAVVVLLIYQVEPERLAGVFSAEHIQRSLLPQKNGANSWGEIVSGLGWGLGYFGMPHILVRFMAIRSADEVRKSRYVAMTWVGISLLAALLIGLLGNPYLAANDFAYTDQATAERIFMRLSIMLFHPIMSGILLSAILAAIMSTVSSQLLVVGSAMINDGFCLFYKNPSHNLTMWLSRLSIVAVTAIGIALAWFPESTVMGLVSYAWAGFGATFAPVVLLSLTWKRLTLTGTLAGMGVGAVSVVVWENGGFYALTSLSAIVPCFVLALLTTVAVSLLTKKPSAQVLASFEQASREARVAMRKLPQQ